MNLFVSLICVKSRQAKLVSYVSDLIKYSPEVISSNFQYPIKIGNMQRGKTGCVHTGIQDIEGTGQRSAKLSSKVSVSTTFDQS